MSWACRALQKALRGKMGLGLGTGGVRIGVLTFTGAWGFITDYFSDLALRK